MREGQVLDLILNGHSFVEKVMGRDGIQELYPLAANRMLFKDVLPDGTARWIYSPPPTNTPMLPVPDTTGPFQNLRVLLADDLWRCNLMAPTGYIEGRSLVMLAREAIGLALAAEEQGARLFSNGIQTSMVIKTEAELDADGRAQLQNSLQRTYAGTENSWRALLLENGLDISKIGLTAQESQYIEARAYQLSDIARIFRVPDVLLGIANGKTATFASAEQFFLSYVKHTLQPWVRRIEQTISRDLLAPSETDLFAKHDLDALLRADLSTRYKAYQMGIASGFLTRNEARTAEDLPMLDGLDEPLSPLNMGPGKSDGTPETPDTPASTPASTLARRLSKNAAAHETKLLADGKPRADVYARLLPGYLTGKTGLSAAAVSKYCGSRLETPGDEAAAVELLTSLLLGTL